jgi:hypothetical protein
MTAQIHDSILLDDRKISIVGVNGEDLFKPADFNLQPHMSVTSCWRGFVCEYKIEANKLFLNTLQINLHEQGPLINNIAPVVSKATFDNVYNHLSLPIDFTGELLAGDQFIRELYVHMGFQPAWKFEIVHRLTISHGSVLDQKDVSQEMKQVREAMTRASKQDLEK